MNPGNLCSRYIDSSFSTSKPTSSEGRLKKNKDDSREQWKFLNSILSNSQENVCPLAATSFQTFFTKKVEDIRALTSGSAPPRVLPRDRAKLEVFHAGDYS